MQPLDRWYHCCEPSPSDGALFLHGGLTTELQVSKQETEEASGLGGSGWYYKTSGLMDGVISGKEATVPLSSRHLAHNSSASSTLGSNPPSLMTSQANLDSSTARKPIVLSDLWVLSPATDNWERIDASVEGFAEENNHSNLLSGSASTAPGTPTRRRRSFLSASSAKTKDAAAARIVASNLARNNPSSLARYNHTLTHLEDGRLVIVGGMDAGHSLQDTVWVADSTLRPVRFSRQRIDTEGNTPVAGKGGSSPTQRRPSTAASHLPPNLLRRKAHSCASVHHGRLLVVVGGEGTNGALKRDCIVLSTTDSPSAAWSVVFYAQALLPQAMGQFVLSPLLNTADAFDCWSTIEIEINIREGTRPEEGHFAPFESAWRRRNIDNSKVAADNSNKTSMYPSIGGGEEGCVSLFCVSGHPAAYPAGQRAPAPTRQLKAEHEGGGKSPSTGPPQNAKEEQFELLKTSGQTQRTPEVAAGQLLVKSSDRFMSLSVLSIISRYIPSLQKWTVGVTACPVPVSSPSGPCPRHAHAAIVCDGSDALWKGSWLADEDRPRSSSTTNSDESDDDDDEEPNHQQLAANVVAEARKRLRSLEGLWRAAMEQGRMESNVIFKAIAEAQLTLVISGGRRSRIVNNQRSVQLVNANPHNHTASSNLRRPSTAATLEASLSVRLLPGTLSDWWVFSFASGRWRLITDDVHPLGVAMVSQHATRNTGKASSFYPFEYQYSAKSLLEDTPTSARRCGHTMQLLQPSRAAHRLMCQKRRRAAILSEKQRQRGPLSHDGLRGLHSTGLGPWDDGDGATTSSGAVDFLMTDQNAVLLSEPFYPPVRLVVFGGIDPAITQQTASIDTSRGSSVLNTNASTALHTSATTFDGNTTYQQSQFAAAKSSKSLAAYSCAVVDGEGFIHRFGPFDDVGEEEGSVAKATKKRSEVTSPKPSADPIVPVASDLPTPIQHFTSHQFGLVVERGIWGGMMPAYEGAHQHPPLSPSGLAQGSPALPPSPMYFGGPFTDDAVASTSIQRLRNRPLLAEGSQSGKTLATMILEAEQLIPPVAASNKQNSRFADASLTQSGKRHHQIGRDVEEVEQEALSPSMLLNAVRERERKMRELQMTASSVSTRPATVNERLDIVSSEPTDTRAHGLSGDELPFQNLALNEGCSPQMPLDEVVALLISHSDRQEVEASKIEVEKELFPADSEDITNSNVGTMRFASELYSRHVDGHLIPHSALNNTYLLPAHVAAKVTTPHPSGSPQTLFPMIKSVATSIAKIDEGYPTDNAGLTVFATYAGRGVSRAAEATTGYENVQLSPLRALSGTPNKQNSTTGVFTLKVAKPTTSLPKRK